MVFVQDVSWLCDGIVQICRMNYRCYASGYRISPLNYKSKSLDKNMTDEEIYRKKIALSMLHKRRSKLRVFDKADLGKVLGRKRTTLPNDKYFNKKNIPKYGSYYNYVKYAEDMRKLQKEMDPHWKTVYKWFKVQKDEPEYTDIGLKFVLPKLTQRQKWNKGKEIKLLRSSVKKCKDAQERKDTFCVETAMDEWERNFHGIQEITAIAKNYGVYRDLFGDKFFYPVVHMDINYDTSDPGYVSPVYYGNELSAAIVVSEPSVTFEAETNSLWTILVVNPDGHLECDNSEYVHWFIGNIRGSDFTSGDVIVDYLQPLPLRGTGYHRIIFVLFKQNKEIDYREYQTESPCLLSDRSFRIKDFFAQYQSQLKPASIRFFQTKWDKSVMETFHHKLDMEEPVYEFIHKEYETQAALKDFPHKKTLHWLFKFMPNEPFYPGGGKLS